jgi:hypothetical protein
MQHLVVAISRHARASTWPGIRALLLLVVLGFSPFVSAQNSTFCPVLNATVASGGTVSINAGNCHAGFGLGVVLVPPAHGTATIGPFGFNQTINYAHNGNSATSDSFVVNDGEAPPNNRIQVNITITPPASAIVIAPSSLSTLTAGVPFSQTLTSSGGSPPYTYTPSGGPLPPGLTLSTAGVISGTPTQRGTYTFSVRSQDSTGAFAIRGYTGTVQTPTLSLVPASATAIQNVPFSLNLGVNGGVPPYSFLHEVVAGPLPPGISLSSSGVLSGTPTTLGTTNFQIRVTDSSTGPGSYFELENYSFTVGAPPNVRIGVNPASVLEDGTGTLQYTVTRSDNLSLPTTVNITPGGTASAGDYTGGVATVVIPASATTATITIDPTADTTVEPDETVIMTVAPGTAYTVGSPSSATATILNDDVTLPTLTLTKVSNGGVGAFGFSGGNGFASQTITTTTAGVGVTGATQTLLAAGLLTTITETVPPGFALTGVTCTGLGNGGTATRSGNAVTLDAAATAPGANIACTFTNTRLPTLTLTKVSNGGVGAFTFTGTNGWTSQTITTTTAGVGVTGATQTLAAAAIATTITEAVPSGFTLTGATCTGLGSGGTATRSGNAVVLDAAATAAGANIACTFTNTAIPAIPTLSINDVTANEGNAGSTAFTFNVNLSAPAGAGGVTFDVATANGTATAGVDYVANALTAQTIPTGSSTYTFTVQVIGDTTFEPNETFFVNITNVVGANVGDGQGTGTINNDDVDACAAISFPYTLPNNLPATLIQAIECANANGTADVINLNGQTVTLTASYGTFSGATGLPQITTEITIRNGSLTRTGSNEFRFLNVSNTGNLTVRDMTLTNGGGIGYAHNGGAVTSLGTASVLTVVNTTISGSRIDSLFNGSAIYSNAIFTIVNSRVVGNGFGRGAITSINGPVLIQNTLIAGNSGPNTVNGAGGLFLSNAPSVTIANSTITGNYVATTVSTQSGGVFASGGTTNLTIRNSIIWGNSNNGNTAPQVVNTTAGTNTVTNCLIQGGLFGALNSDPLFVTPITASATPTTAGNSQLSDSSPAIDAGANANVPADTFDVNGNSNTSENAPDLDGNPRRYDDTGVIDTGTGTAPIVDLGAFERQTDTLLRADVSITKTDGRTSVGAGTNTTYTITASNAGPSNAPGSTVLDIFPAACTSVSWTCVGAGGGTCPANGTGNINQSVNLPSGGSVVFSAICAISTGATGTLVNTATVAVAGGITDPTPDDNSATDTNTISAFPTLSINDVSITEGNGGTQTVNFIVTRTGTTASAVGFSFATGDDTATAGSDYITATGTGTIPAGGATGTTQVSVTVSGDAVFENEERFFVNLSLPTNAAIADGQGIGTITNDDTAPTLAINDVSIVEGNSGTSSLVFTVTRTGLTALPATFTVATADGTATAPSDYLSALAGTTSIAAGGATGTTTLTATINGDNEFEAAEVFVVNLSAPSNATIAVGQGEGTIVNDDTPGVVITQSGGTTDVAEGGTGDSYTLVLTSQPTANVSIALAPNAQVTAATSPVVFTSVNWNTPQTVTVGAVDDAVVEGPHTGTIGHTVTSADAVYDGFTVPSVTVNITDNDLPTLAINDVSVSEGNGGTQTLSFTVTRTGTTASAVGFSFATADDTATAGSDYVTATGTGTIPSGGATGTTPVSVTINGDAIFENTETFTVTLSAPTNATISRAQGVGTISNDDTAPTLAINSVSVVEGNSGTRDLEFTVTRTGLTALPASFTAATANGSATAPSDYLAALAGSTTIAAGGATGTTTLTATINGDNVVEPNETFTVTLSAPVSATIATATGTGTITNDDIAGVTLTQSGGSTNVTEGGATDSYTLVLTSEPTAPVSITLNPGTQVTAATSPVVFTSANWNTPQIVTVTAVDDALVEGNHTGTITHAMTSADPAYNNFTVAGVTVNITDNDTAGVSVVETGSGTAVTEGGATDTYTVVLTSQPSAAVTITLTGTQVGTSASSLSFTSADWNVARTVTVTATDDNVVEGTHNGSVAYTLVSGDPNYQVLAMPPTPVTITDNDSAIVQFNPTGVSQSEASTPMAFTVTLSNPVASGVTVTVNSTAGTAGAADFTAISGGTVSFPANSTTAQTVNVAINNDALDEDDEQFTLALTNPVATGPVTLGAAATATGTIQDDDAPPVLSVANVSQPEGNATNTLTFTVNLSPVSGRAVNFTRATADGTATVANNDYVALAAAPISIAAGQTSVSIPVTINGDTVFEGNESFSLNLTAVDFATPGTLSATATLVDDDQQSTTTEITSDEPDPSAVNAPYTVQFTVRGQSGSPTGTVTVNDGTGASCGPVTLVAGTPPASSASCVITSTTPGTKTLTATYVPANTAFGASSDTEPHTVVVVAPALAYAPTTGSTVAFTGVTTIGTTGNGTIAATPSGGAGTGAAATTTINACTLGGTNPGSFAGAAAINLSFVGNTTTPQNLALTCTSQQTAQTATLTCNETRGSDAPVQRQWPLNCPAGTPVAPSIAYNPTTGSNIAFTGVTTIGTTGNGTIAATPSGGAGTGAAATTTINTCTLGGTNPGSFAGAAAINLSFVGNTTTPQNLALTCTSQQTAQTATLTCNETRGSDAPVQRQWPLNCPAGTPVAPSIAYNPTTGTTVAFTGVTTIGTTGNGTIAATPSGGIGTGAGATTTINGCTLGGTNPAAFAGAGAINLSFVGNTTTAQNLALTCTAGAAAQTATLTCNETRGTAPAVPRQWSLSCPAGPLLPLTAAPAIGGTVNVTGTAGGSTTTAPITLTNPNPIPVSLTCTAPAFPFTATPLVFSIPTGGNAPVTIGISPAAAGNYTGTLSCTIAGSPQVLTFNLAGTLVPAIAVDAMAAWSRWLLVLLMLFGGLALGYSRRH